MPTSPATYVDVQLSPEFYNFVKSIRRQGESIDDAFERMAAVVIDFLELRRAFENFRASKGGSRG